jgi:hypothetical protein
MRNPITVIVLALAGLSCGLASAQTTPEVLPNPGFEQVDDQGWAVGWERWPAVSPEPGAVSVDANMPFRGSRSLRLHHEKATSYTRGQQAITVEPNQRYYFRVWMKGENIKPEEMSAGSMGARLYIEGIGGRDYATARQGGTFSWQQLQIGPLNSGQGGKVTVMCYLHQATGTVWFDEVQVIKATPDFEAELGRQRAHRRWVADLAVAQAGAEEARDPAALAALVRLGESLKVEALPDRLDYRAGPPYFPEHRELFGVMSQLNARRLPGTTLAVWTADPFAPLPLLGLVPRTASPALHLVMGTGEREQGVINLCHLGVTALRLRVAVTGLEGNLAPRVTLREAMPVESFAGEMLYDALPRLPDAALRLAPGVFRQLWLEVSSAGSPPGRYRGTVTLQGPGRVRHEVPLTVEVLPVRLPNPLPIATWNYSYQHEPLIKERWEQARADLVAHHINAYCWPSGYLPWPKFDEAGKLLPLDWTAFEKGVASHDNIRWLLLWPQFEWANNLQLRQELEVGSALWEQRFIVWFQAVIAGLKERGFGYDRIVWYPTDEPTTATRVKQQITAARAMHQADPQALVLANPYGACPDGLREQMGEVTDVWCPELTWASGGLMPYFRQTSQKLWTYQVLGQIPAFARYRLAFWKCFSEGITGHGFWAYADCGGSNWDRHDAARNDYAVIYDGDPEELIPSKRWEAWREGVEDYTYLWLLQQAQGERAAPLVQAGVEKLLAEPSPEALAALRVQVLRQLARVAPQQP